MRPIMQKLPQSTGIVLVLAALAGCEKPTRQPPPPPVVVVAAVVDVELSPPPVLVLPPGPAVVAISVVDVSESLALEVEVPESPEQAKPINMAVSTAVTTRR